MKRKSAQKQVAQKRRKIKKYIKQRKLVYSTPPARAYPTPSSNKFYRYVDREGIARDTNMDSKNKGGFSSSTGGAVGHLKKFARKSSKNPSIATIQKKGITVCYESRKTATATNAEAIAIGHTTMPGKQCAINAWRAVVKYACNKAGTLVRDFGNLMVNGDFLAGDEFIIYWYNNNTTTSTTNNPFPVTSTMTFDGMAATIAAFFDDQTGIYDDRWESLEIKPAAGSRMKAVNIELNNLKISVWTKSALKIQNVTLDNNADNEADDITRVPLAGKLFGVKGNNFVKKSTSAMLTGLFNTADEDALFGAWTRQEAAIIGSTSTYFYAAGPGSTNSNQTSFFKPSEPPRQYEISNCYAESNILIKPGEIKTDTMYAKYTFGLSYYLHLLYDRQNTNNTNVVYNQSQGKCNVVYLEKMVGRPAGTENAVKTWVELEFRQSVLVHGQGSTFTMPITYQGDFA